MTEEHRPPKDSRQLPPVFTRGGLLYTWLRVLSAEEKPFNGFFGSRGTRGSGGDVPPGLECFATMRMVQDFSHTAAQMGGKDSQQGISLQPLPGAPSSLLCFHRDPFTGQRILVHFSLNDHGVQKMDPSKEELAHHFETAIDAARHHLIGESMARSQTNSFPSSSKSFDNSSQGRSAQDVLNLIDTLSREARKDREEKQKARKEALSQSRWFSVRKEASPESSTTTSVPPNMSSSTKTPEEAAEEARKKLLDRLKAENPIGSLSSPLSRYMAGWESGKTGETFDKFFNSIKDGRWKEYAGTLPLSASTTAERIVDKVKDWISSFK